MGTYTTYKAVLEAIKTRLETMVDASGNTMFAEVEYGRRGSMDEDMGGAYIIPPPRSILIPPEDRELKKTHHIWNYVIFCNHIGENEQDTFDAIIIKLWKIYDTFMEVDTPPEGAGYNRCLWAIPAGNPLIRDLEIVEMNLATAETEDRRGFEQIAAVQLYVTLRI